jgi:hypothetical protein
LTLVVHHLETEREVYRYQRWYAIPGGRRLLHLEVPVRRCVFPAPGRYALSLHFDANTLTVRALDVRPEAR